MTETLDLSIYVKREGGQSRMELAVEGVACAGCIRKIEGGLKKIPASSTRASTSPTGGWPWNGATARSRPAR
jgi:hypothetical protein